MSSNSRADSASPGFRPGGGGDGGARGGAGAGDPLSGLSARVSGCLLTLALDAGPGGGEGGGTDLAALGALLEPDATACRTALATLAALDRPERARALAGLLRRARASVPEGIEQVHAGWLRAALEGEATPILRAITDGLPPEVGAVAREIVAARADSALTDPVPVIPDETLAELRRAAFGSLVPMPLSTEVARADAPGWLRLAVLPLPALQAEIDRRGAATLGTSLAGAPPAVVARAAAAAGSALASVMLEAAGRSTPAEERERARSLVAAAGARASEGEVGSTTYLGLLALAGDLPAGAARVIAQRLPPRLGRILLDR